MPENGADIYKRFFNTLPTMMGVLDFDGRFTELNAAWEQQLGYPAAEMLSRPCLDFVHPEDRGLVREHQDKLLAGAPQFLFEARFLCKDGGAKWLHLRCAADRDKGRLYTAALDITARKVTEEALRQSEVTLRKIIDSAPLAMSIVSMDGAIEYINKKAEETFGFPNSEIPTMDAWWRKAYPDEAYRKEVVESWMGRVYKAIEGKTEIPGCEYQVTCKDGTVKTCFIFGVIAAEKIFVMFNDVSVRVAVEQTLRDNEKTLRRVLQQAPVGIAIHALDGKIEFINSKFVGSFGYKPEDIPDMAAWTRRAYPEESYRAKLLALWGEWVEKSARTGQEMEGGEFRVVCKDGSVKTAFITGVVTPDKKVVSLVEDITARVETERALRESESLYRALIETTRTGYVVLDGHGKVLDANREYVRLSGHSDLKEVLGRSVLEWSAPHHQARAWEAVELVVRDGRLSNFELDYVDKAGRITTIEINATVVSRGGVPQILGLCRDISARSRTEAQLRDSEALYRALVETTRTGYVVVDTAGKVLDANREYVRLTGHSDLKEILGRPVTEWTAPDKIEENAAAVARCARDGYIFNFETDYSDKTGKRIPIEINATVVSRGGLAQIHTLCRDITQRRRTDEELRSLNQELEQRVSERTAELTKANIELSHEIAHRMDAEKSREKLQSELLQSQKLEVVGRLAGGIAHDFNNILVAISGYAEFLMKTMPEGAPAREDLAEIVRETERGAMLTRQLTAIGRRQPLEAKALDINLITEDSCSMLKRLIGANMRLELKLDPGIDSIKADPGQVSQVILNLVVNARDAMPDGGDISISTANEELNAPVPAMRLTPPPGRYVTLSISDTGCGMDEQTAAQIFEPFFTTKGEGKGTGLGLSTVYGILQQAGGGIALRTSPGKGASFKIYFPRATT